MLEKLTSRFPVAIRLMAMNLALTAGTFLSGVLLARALAPEGRGELAALLLWTVTVSNVVLWGTHTELSRRAAQSEAAVRPSYRLAYLWATVGSVIGIALYLTMALAGARLSEHYDPTNILIAAVIIPASAVNAAQIQMELGRSKFSTFNLARGAFLLINLAVTAVLFALMFTDVRAYLIGYIVSAIIGSLIAQSAIARALPARKADDTGMALREVLTASRYYGLSTLFTAFALQADKLLISGLFETAILGLYVVASSIAQIQHTVGEALSQMFFAQMSSIKDNEDIDKDWLAARLRQTVALYVLICIGAMIVIPPLVPFVYGEAYRGAVVILLILLPALAIKGMTRPFEEVFRGLGRPKLSLASLVCSTALILLATIAGWLVRDIRIVALGTGLAYVAGLIVAAGLMKRMLAIRVRDALLPRPADFMSLWTRGTSILGKRN